MTGQSILITGACGDIGRAMAMQFAGARSVRLGLCDVRSSDQAAAQVEDLRQRGAEVIYRQADVTDPTSVARFVEEAATAFGSIDICIGNAGIVERGALIDLPVDAWRRTLEVNLTGCFLIGQAAARVMKRTARGGHIIFISSWVQDTPREGIGGYCVSKSGLKMLAQAMALELGRDGIRVNLVAPGFVDAGLTGQNLQRNPDRRAAMEASIPLGRLLSADEVARAVRMLCSPDAAYVTGTTLLLDGGASLRT